MDSTILKKYVLGGSAEGENQLNSIDTMNPQDEIDIFLNSAQSSIIPIKYDLMSIQQLMSYRGSASSVNLFGYLLSHNYFLTNPAGELPLPGNFRLQEIVTASFHHGRDPQPIPYY